MNPIAIIAANNNALKLQREATEQLRKQQAATKAEQKPATPKR